MLKGKKILIIEDSSTMRLKLKMMLEKEGATLVEAGSEWGMFAKIYEYGVLVDLIIMDLVLSSEDGLKLISKLKEAPLYKDIPVIILTEKVEVDSILAAKELGIKNYLRKPIKKEALISRIINALDVEDSKGNI